MSGVELRERLLDDCDVQPGFLEQTMEQIQGFGSSLQKEFYEYLEEKKLSEETRNVMERFQLLAVGAFMMRDWQEKQSEGAAFASAYLN